MDRLERSTAATTAAGRLLEDTLDPLGRLAPTQVDGRPACLAEVAYDNTGPFQSLAQGPGAAERLAAFAYDAAGRATTWTSCWPPGPRR